VHGNAQSGGTWRVKWAVIPAFPAMSLSHPHMHTNKHTEES